MNKPEAAAVQMPMQYLMRDLEDLLTECVDALQRPGWDNRDRDVHIRRLRECSQRTGSPEDIRGLLSKTIEVFAAHAKQHPAILALETRGQDDCLVAAITSVLRQSNAKRYVSTAPSSEGFRPSPGAA